MTIRKAIAQFLTGLLAWGTAVVVSEPAAISASEWVVAAGVAVGAFLVWLIPNDPSTVSVRDRLAALGMHDDEPTTGAPDRGAADFVGVLVAIALIVAIAAGLRYLGVW